MIDIGKKLEQIEDVFDLGDRFEDIPDPRDSHHLLPLSAILRLLVVMFVFYRVYTLLGIENKQRNRASEDRKEGTKKLFALAKLVMGGPLSEQEEKKLREKIQDEQPIISDAQMRRVIASITPSLFTDLLYRMTMTARRNKTWSGRSIAVIDATSEGGCQNRRCPYCKKANGGGCYHLGVHLVQMNDPPYFVMDHQFAEDGEGEATVAKRMANRNFCRARGKYADLVLVDFYYFTRAFFQMHIDRGMDVVTRYHQTETDIPDKYKILKKAQQRVAGSVPDRQFEDKGRNRQVYMWNCGTFDGESALNLNEPIWVIKMLFVSEDGEADLHWLVTTLDVEEETLREVYELPIKRWRIEINEFRQQKHFESFTHKQTHDREGIGLRNFRMLYLICFNLLQWLAWRNLPSIRDRLQQEDGYGLITFRNQLTRWLIEFLVDGARRIKDHSRDPPDNPDRDRSSRPVQFTGCSSADPMAEEDERSSDGETRHPRKQTGNGHSWRSNTFPQNGLI